MRDADNMGDHRLDASLPERGAGLAVPVTTLDVLFPAPPPFLLKADTQGSEPAILAGMRAMLERHRAQAALVLEFWPRGIVSSGRTVQAMLEPLAALGLTVFVLDETPCRLWPTTIAALADAAATDLAPGTGAFRNIAATARGQQRTDPRTLRLIARSVAASACPRRTERSASAARTARRGADAGAGRAGGPRASAAPASRPARGRWRGRQGTAGRASPGA
jgi:hypothetical protein